MRKLLYFFCLLTCFPLLQAQNSIRLSPDADFSQELQRLEIQSGEQAPFFTDMGLYGRAVLAYLDSVKATDAIAAYLQQRQRQFQNHLLPEGKRLMSTRPMGKHFYRSPLYLYEVHRPDFFMQIRPLLHFQAGTEQSDTNSHVTFLNRRGLNLRAGIDNKVFIETQVLETQESTPYHVQDRINEEEAIPGAGFYKVYDSRLTEAPNDGVDYLLAQGRLSFQLTPHIGTELGHGRHFIGDGMRSLLLSDFSNNYFYLKFNTRIWKFHYQNLFTELIQDYDRGPDRVLPKKYMAAHYLNIQLGKRLRLGLFEATVFARDNGFELQYLNPVILYRAVEQSLGSPDNALVGLTGRYLLLKQFSLYGQFVLDEFSFGELFLERRGWWANKYGVQLGAKYINAFGVPHLDIQAEYNTIRPYTYTFRSAEANYTHYNQPLAHPLGANFREFLARLQYRPAPHWLLRGQLLWANYGLDTLSSNWGKDVFRPYTEIEQEYGNKTGQGVSTQQLQCYVELQYELFPAMYIEAFYRYRNENAELDALDRSSHWWGLGLRYFLQRRPFFF